MANQPKHPRLISFPEIRKPDPEPFLHGQVPTDPEVNYEAKPPRGAWEFWQYVLDATDTLRIKNVYPGTDYGDKCGRLLKLLIQKFKMPRLMALGKFYATQWMKLRKAYNWKHPPSPIQFSMYIDKIDFCETNGIPLNPANRVVGGEDYTQDPFAAAEAALKKKKSDGQK